MLRTCSIENITRLNCLAHATAKHFGHTTEVIDRRKISKMACELCRRNLVFIKLNISLFKITTLSLALALGLAPPLLPNNISTTFLHQFHGFAAIVVVVVVVALTSNFLESNKCCLSLRHHLFLVVFHLASKVNSVLHCDVNMYITQFSHSKATAVSVDVPTKEEKKWIFM